MKFTLEQLDLIKETRTKINKLEAEQNESYKNLLDKLNMNKNAEEWMFSYIYYNNGSIKNIESKNSEKP
jgi:hypothetical protein